MAQKTRVARTQGCTAWLNTAEEKKRPAPCQLPSSQPALSQMAACAAQHSTAVFTLTGRMVAPGATPTMPLPVSIAARMPEQWVPWPWPSCRPSPMKSLPPFTLMFSCAAEAGQAWGSMISSCGSRPWKIMQGWTGVEHGRDQGCSAACILSPHVWLQVRAWPAQGPSLRLVHAEHAFI